MDQLTERVEEGQRTGKAVRPGRQAAAPPDPPAAPSSPAPTDPPDPEEVPVHVALVRVMRDVTSVGKDDRNEQQQFMYRGIDSILNAVGPAFRRHGVLVMPGVLKTERRDIPTRSGGTAHETNGTVTYKIYGPAGDHLEAKVPAESMDSGDKGTAKMMSVAFRTLLIQILALPTGEPDPDSQTYERGQAAPENPADVARNELLDEFRKRGIDGQRVRDAYYRRHGVDVLQHNDAASIIMFTSELRADAETVLAPPQPPPDVGANAEQAADTPEGYATLGDGGHTPDDVRE